MNKIQQIMPSKMRLEDLYVLNEHVYINSQRLRTVGKMFSFPCTHDKRSNGSDTLQYSINKYGYRGPNWTFEMSPAFFGCSCIFGIGVKYPAAERVASNLKIRSIPNLGLPGAGIINIIKSFAAFTEHHTVSDAFIMIPPIHRLYLPEYRSSTWVSRNFIPGHSRGDRALYKSAMSVFNDDIKTSYTVDYIDWAKQIAKNKNIRIHWGSWEIDTVNFLKEIDLDPFNWKPVDYARDDAHPGPKSHANLAKFALKKIVDKK